VSQTIHERILHSPGLVFDDQSVEAAKKWLETARFEDAGSSYINTRSAVVMADLMKEHRAEGALSLSLSLLISLKFRGAISKSGPTTAGASAPSPGSPQTLSTKCVVSDVSRLLLHERHVPIHRLVHRHYPVLSLPLWLDRISPQTILSFPLSGLLPFGPSPLLTSC
jgi:hypothetical protein